MLLQAMAAEEALDMTTNPEEGCHEQEKVSPKSCWTFIFLAWLESHAWLLPLLETLGDWVAPFVMGRPAPLAPPDEYVVEHLALLGIHRIKSLAQELD